VGRAALPPFARVDARAQTIDNNVFDRLARSMKEPSMRAAALVVTLIGCLALGLAPCFAADPENWVNPPGKPVPGVEHKTFHSKSMNHDVGYNIYLPPVIAVGNHIVTKVTGKTMTDFVHDKNRHTKGYLAIQHLDPARSLKPDPRSHGRVPASRRFDRETPARRMGREPQMTRSVRTLNSTMTRRSECDPQSPW
jgi:hypothetical protein